MAQARDIKFYDVDQQQAGNGNETTLKNGLLLVESTSIGALFCALFPMESKWKSERSCSTNDRFR